MFNTTYKHLEDRFRLGAFTLGQWVQLFASATAALVFAVYVSPFPTEVTIVVSVLGGGLPFVASYAAMGTEFSIGELLRAAMGFHRRQRRFAPGAGDFEHRRLGYLVAPDPNRALEASAADSQPNPTGDALWDY